MKKVLLVIDNMSCGGAQKMLAFLGNNLSKHGYDVTIMAYASVECFYKVDNEINVVYGGLLSGKRYSRHIKKISFIRKCIIEYQPDIIIAFMEIPAVLSIIATIGLKIPVVYCDRGDPFQHKSFLERLKLLGSKFASYYVFQTEGAKSYYSKRIQKKSSVIENPVTFGKKKIVATELRKDKIVCVGRFDINQKRQDLMIKAFYKVASMFPHVELQFIGDGEDRQLIENMIKEYHLDEKAKMIGEVTDVYKHIIDAKVFVLTSDFEGIPNALIEAMCCGVPCVSTDCSPGGARMLLDNYKNGILVPCNDCEAIFEAVSYILNNPNEAQRMGIEAQRVVDRFNPEIILNKWIAVINYVSK